MKLLQRWRQTTIANQLMVVSTAIMAIATLLLAIAGYFQYLTSSQQLQAAKEQSNIMRGQLEFMNSSSKQTQDLIAATQESANASQSIADRNKDLVEQAGKQANASQTQANASLAQAGAAKQTAQVAAQTFAIGERPYLSIQRGNLQLIGDKPPIADFWVQNTGKTPANNGWFEVTFSSQPMKGNLTYVKEAGEIVQFFIAAGTEVHLTATANFQLADANVKAITEGKLFFYVYGKGLYEDGIGKNYSFDFCYRYHAEGKKLVFCSVSERPK